MLGLEAWGWGYPECSMPTLCPAQNNIMYDARLAGDTYLRCIASSSATFWTGLSKQWGIIIRNKGLNLNYWVEYWMAVIKRELVYSLLQVHLRSIAGNCHQQNLGQNRPHSYWISLICTHVPRLLVHLARAVYRTSIQHDIVACYSNTLCAH